MKTNSKLLFAGAIISGLIAGQSAHATHAKGHAAESTKAEKENNCGKGKAKSNKCGAGKAKGAEATSEETTENGCGNSCSEGQKKK